MEAPPAGVAQSVPGSRAEKDTGRSTAAQADPYGNLVPLRVMPKVHLEDTPPVAGVLLGPDASTDQSPAGFSHSALMFPRSFELRPVPAPGTPAQVVPPQVVSPQVVAPQAALPQPDQDQPVMPQPAVVPPVPQQTQRSSAKPDPSPSAKPGRGSVRPQHAAALPQPARRPSPAKPVARVLPRLEKVRSRPTRAAPRRSPREPKEDYGDLPELVPLPQELPPAASR